MVNGFCRIKCVRDVVLTTCAAFAMAAPVPAQTPDSAYSSAERRQTTLIGGQQSPAATLERCVEVEIGKESAFGCINQKLKREVDRVNPTINLPPLDARSPDVRVGNVNEAAVRQQYGSNYGRSAFPFRPPTPTFVLPGR